MGRGALAGLTRLCYMITQPVGRPPVKCPAEPLMNGRNMSRITSRHAAARLSLMALCRAKVQVGGGSKPGGSCRIGVRNGCRQ